MDIYVVRVSGKTNIKTVCKSDPCADCLNFIKKMGIRNIIFSISEDQIYKVKVNEWDTTYVTKGKKKTRVNEE